MLNICRVACCILVACGFTKAAPIPIPKETPEEAKARHERVAERRKGVDIICHRGASEFAHENTLEAYRATFELGGDGNEIDIRATKDGVLVCFHDDMLDRILEAYGDVSEYSWKDLQGFSFRTRGRFVLECRIPTLVEVLDLHRKHAGLLHLDIKRPKLDQAISDLLTKMDMWDHVGYCNSETGGVILKDPRFKPRKYKGGLYLDHGEIFPEAIEAMLKKPGDGVIVDDPRGVAVALGRKFLSISKPSEESGILGGRGNGVTFDYKLLKNAVDWDQVADSPEDRKASASKIRMRARAAEHVLSDRDTSKEAFAALEERVRKRSLHKDWMWHGLDGEKSLRTLILLKAPNAVELARFVLWRDDPALDPVVNPMFKNPRSWTDWRQKTIVFPTLQELPGAATEKLCRDYLALTDDEANKIGPPQFEAATRTLLAVSPKTETALELMKHRLQVVRGRAILMCLASAKEAWAKSALEKGAPHALAYIVNQ